MLPLPSPPAAPTAAVALLRPVAADTQWAHELVLRGRRLGAVAVLAQQHLWTPWCAAKEGLYSFHAWLVRFHFSSSVSPISLFNSFTYLHAAAAAALLRLVAGPRLAAKHARRNRLHGGATGSVREALRRDDPRCGLEKKMVACVEDAGVVCFEENIDADDDTVDDGGEEARVETFLLPCQRRSFCRSSSRRRPDTRPSSGGCRPRVGTRFARLCSA